MTVLQAVFLLLGICAALALICIAALWWEKNWLSDRYDERQKISRYKSYRLAFWLGFLYYLVATGIMLFQVEGKKTIEPYLLLFFGIMFQALVLHIYGLLTGSALPFGEKPGWTAFSYLFIGSLQILNLWNWGKQFPVPGMPLTGQGSSKWVFLILAVESFVLALLYFIYALGRDKED